ncbi:MAG: winged helix-turn-helix transcriptional regulator [Chloroflexi bacterium]|nr:winged helix-turn-helix transcriptional regulator [Chloroflexota bacterium]
MITSTSPAIEYDLEIDLVTRFFQVLSDPTRVRIIELLLDGEQNVTELVHGLGVPQARVSSHLACLRWCGYIGTRREGKFVYYRITDPRVSELMRLARTILAENAEAVASCLRLNEETA